MKKNKIDICEKHKETEFFFITNSKGSGSYQCRLCFNEKAVARNRRNKIRGIQYLGGKCEHCGDSFEGHPEVLDFHHLNPSEKEISPARLFARAWKNITPELDKCIILCANCHRIEHARLRSL